MIFIFHTSMIGNITKTTIYQKIGKGGTEAVAFFFVLLGFIEAIQKRNFEYHKPSKNLKFCAKKVKNL